MQCCFSNGPALKVTLMERCSSALEHYEAGEGRGGSNSYVLTLVEVSLLAVIGCILPAQKNDKVRANSMHIGSLYAF